jgi:WD40 repeat protein
MKTNPKPVIFLAFANDYEGAYGYLPELASERRNLQAVLDRAQQEGLCEVVLRSDATLDDLIDVFQDERYRGRIALFHFGGHAGAYELLLQIADGKNAAAYAEGLTAFFGRQPNLRLIFLNGCSTQPHVQGLHAAGVAAVIATDAEIDDRLAGDFALRFYKGLAAGESIEAGFHAAEAVCKAANAEVSEIIAAGHLPWMLSVCPGAEEVLRWSLPEAAGDPLFGLPSLPPGDLPEQPFRNILWFRRADAELFFGRGYDIRELYQRVTAPGAAPIVLYYGQSGVGKSSLLAAGLRPRLERAQTAVYVRRDQALGLTGTLTASLAANFSGSSGASGKVSGADLLARWRDVEAETGKPLTVILDQMEEVYTREVLPDEMRLFLDTLAAMFTNPATRPQGRLILSFRKEWLAEIEKLVAERQLPRTKVFLQRLDRRGIVEAVLGPTHSERFRQHFGLSVEDGLAAEIADDLLADPSSAVAPTLQILLSKLWDQAKARDYDRPHFDRLLYHDLRRQGLLLSDFLDQQLTALRAAQPAAVASGLALDLLAFHTTPLGTAEQRTLAELRVTYAHQAVTLDGLRAACRDLYLLVDPAENRPDAEPASRLAHDTLAPLVRHRFEASEAPGQRARRILESRAVDWEDGNAGTPLDTVDLAVVENGQHGMRTWTQIERSLLDASRRKYAAGILAEKRRRIFVGTGVVLVLLFAVIALWYAQQSLYEEGLRKQAEQSNRAIEAQRLAAEGIKVVENKPQLAMLLAVEGARQQADASEPVIESAQNDLRVLLDQVGGTPLIQDADDITARFSPAGAWIAIAHDSVIDLRKSTNPTETIQVLSGQQGIINIVTFSPDDRLLASANENGEVLVWEFDDLRASPLAHLCTHDTGVMDLTFTGDGDWLVSMGGDGRLCAGRVNSLGHATAATVGFDVPVASAEFLASAALAPFPQGAAVARTRWDVDTGRYVVEIWNPEDPTIAQRVFQSPWDLSEIAVSPDERWIAGAPHDGTSVFLWDMELADSQEPRDLYSQECESISGNYTYLSPSQIDHVTFSPDSQWLAVGGTTPSATVQVWNLDKPGSEFFRLCGHKGGVTALSFSPEGDRLATAGADATIRLWNIFVGVPLHVLRGHEDQVTGIHFDQTGARLLSSSMDRSARTWDLSSPYAAATKIETPGGLAQSALFSPDGVWLVSRGASPELIAHHVNDLTAQPRTIATSSRSLAFANLSNRLAIGERNGALRLWDIDRQQEDLIFVPDADSRRFDGITALAFSTDDQWLVAYDEGDWSIGENNKTLTLWDLTNAPPVSQSLTLPGDFRVSTLVFTDDDKLLFGATVNGVFNEATGVFDYALLTWDTERLQKPPRRDTLFSYPVSSVRVVVFSADRTKLLFGADAGVYIIDLENLQKDPIKPVGLNMGITDAAFSKNNRWLAASGEEIRVLGLNNLEVGTPLIIRSHNRIVNDVDFSPDNEWLASTGHDGVARLSILDLDKLLELACQTVGRNLTSEEWRKYFPGRSYRRTCEQWPEHPSVSQ